MNRPFTIHCTDCGAPYQTVRKNTKYCPFHSFLRGFKYVRVSPRTHSCSLCSRTILPHTRNQRYCTDCWPTNYPPIKCALCTKLASPVSKEVAICGLCMDDPKNDAQIHKLLHQKDQWLKRQNAAADPTENLINDKESLTNA